MYTSNQRIQCQGKSTFGLWTVHFRGPSSFGRSKLYFKMHHWCRQQGCVFDYRANQDSLRFSVIPLNVTFEDIYNFVHYLHTAWSNPDLKGADESGEGFQKDYGVKEQSNEDTMKAAY